MPRLKVIKRTQLPSRLPISQTIVLWLLLDRLQAPQWAWAVFATLGLIVWILCIFVLSVETQVALKELE